MTRFEKSRLVRALTAASYAAIGCASVALAGETSADRQNVNRTTNAMTAAQMATLIKDAKLPLSDSIAAAEKHCGGKAVRAECCNRSRGPSGNAMCLVTVLIDNNRMVEAAVDTQTGQVVSRREVALLERGGTYSDDFAMARSWQKCSDLTGKRVTNAANEDLGKIEDIVIDATTGRILYGVLSYGGVFGMGDKLFAIPWTALPLGSDSKAFVLDVDRDRLKNATTFDPRQWPNFADEQFSTATYRHFDQQPYWAGTTSDDRRSDRDQDRANRGNDGMRKDDDASRTAAGDGRGTIVAGDESNSATRNERDRWNRHATVWQKASDLCAKPVCDNQNESIGKVTELVIDPQAGRAIYAIVSTRGKYFAIPWSAISLQADGKQFVLAFNRDRLTDKVGFSANDWPNMTDQRWADETFAYYSVAPYWRDEQPSRSQSGMNR